MAKKNSVAVAPPASASLVDADQALKASKALLAHIQTAAREQSATSTKRSLLADASEDPEGATADTPIWMVLTTKRHIHNSARLQPGKIVLPHPLHDVSASSGSKNGSDSGGSDLSICVISADPQRAYKNIVASAAFPEHLRRRITRVVDLTHLKAKWKAYEAQRKLAAEHDIFVADDRIINRLPKALGKSFYKSTAKRPIPVVLAPSRPKVDGKRVKAEKKGKRSGEDDDAGAAGETGVNARPAREIADEIEKAVGAALVHLSPSTNTAVKVGYAGWGPDKIAENLQAAAEALVGRFVPQKWQNVRGVYVKGPETASLPVWLTDELWIDGEKDVLPEGAEEPNALPTSRKRKGTEKPNIGKKRKSLGEDEDGADILSSTKEPKAKKPKTKQPLPESNDERLDNQIAEHKAKLRKQKSAAKKAMEA